MKKLHKFLFKHPWGEMILLQVFFFGGIIVGSTDSIANLFVGLIWFGASALWMLGRQNNWNK